MRCENSFLPASTAKPKQIYGKHGDRRHGKAKSRSAVSKQNLIQQKQSTAHLRFTACAVLFPPKNLCGINAKRKNS
ncbi:MAG: hypothetical protein EGQ73_01745 [Clostridiales bacterium]|nr:hypothetical protein [Clostridiales bacterium]